MRQSLPICSIPKTHFNQRIFCSKSEKLKCKRIIVGITGSIAAVECVKPLQTVRLLSLLEARTMREDGCDDGWIGDRNDYIARPTDSSVNAPGPARCCHDTSHDVFVGRCDDYR